MKYKWSHFWNIRFSRAVGSFTDHFERLCELDKMGMQRSLNRFYHKCWMRAYLYAATFCDFMCKIVGH